MTITVPANKQVYQNIDNSSRFGQICSDSDSLAHLGLFLSFSTGSAGDLTLIPVGKLPAVYTAPDIA